MTVHVGNSLVSQPSKMMFRCVSVSGVADRDPRMVTFREDLEMGINSSLSSIPQGLIDRWRWIVVIAPSAIQHAGVAQDCVRLASDHRDAQVAVFEVSPTGPVWAWTGRQVLIYHDAVAEAVAAAHEVPGHFIVLLHVPGNQAQEWLDLCAGNEMWDFALGRIPTRP